MHKAAKVVITIHKFYGNKNPCKSQNAGVWYAIDGYLYLLVA